MDRSLPGIAWVSVRSDEHQHLDRPSRWRSAPGAAARTAEMAVQSARRQLSERGQPYEELVVQSHGLHRQTIRQTACALGGWRPSDSGFFTPLVWSDQCHRLL